MGYRHSLTSTLGRTFGLRLLLEPRVQLIAIGAVLLLVLYVRLGQVVYTGTTWLIGYDFSAYWLAARHILENSPIYTLEQLGGPYSPQQQFLYLYPPLLAVLITPLAAVFPSDFQSPAWIWATLGVGCVASTVLFLGRRSGRSYVEIMGLIALAFALPPVALELLMGNVHLVLLGLLAIAWMGVRSASAGGDLAAGVALGFATLIKVFPGLLIVWLVLTGRHRAAVIAMAAMGTLALATIPLTGADPWLAYPTVLANLAPPVNLSTVLAPTTWLAPAVGFDLARLLVTAVGIAVLVWSALTQPAPTSFAVAIIVSLLISPAMYMSYLALAVLPLLLAYIHTRRRKTLMLVYLFFFASTQMTIWDPEGDLPRALATSSFLAVLVYLLVLGGQEIERARRATPVTQPG